MNQLIAFNQRITELKTLVRLEYTLPAEEREKLMIEFTTMLTE